MLYTEAIVGSTTITFSKDDGYRKMNIRVRAGSTGTCTILGNGIFPKRNPSPIVLSAGDSETIIDEFYCLEGITVTVNSGCTIDFSLSQN